MADRFEAKARIPTRPLSYANKDLAENRELMIDYEEKQLYVRIDGVDYNITADVNAIIQEVIKQLQDNPDIFEEIFKDLTITIPGTGGDPSDPGYIEDQILNLNDTLIDVIIKLAELEELLNITRDEMGNITKIEIVSTSITETPEKQFVSQDEKDAWNNKADIFMLDVVINPGSSYWTSNGEAPYTQQINVESILETDYPIVDIKLSDVYATAMEELNNYAYIYRISTHNGYIIVYATQMTEVALTIQMKVDR